MANLDLKSPGLQKLLLAILLAGGALGVFYFTHLVPFGFTNSNEKLAALRSDYERKSSELARARASVAGTGHSARFSWQRSTCRAMPTGHRTQDPRTRPPLRHSVTPSLRHSPRPSAS